MSKSKGSPPDTTGFGNWYSKIAEKNRLDPNPDDPRHFYDYRAAFKSGAAPDSTGHLPSEFKQIGHPRLIISGVDTRTGRPASPNLVKANKEANKRVLSQFKDEK